MCAFDGGTEAWGQCVEALLWPIWPTLFVFCLWTALAFRSRMARILPIPFTDASTALRSQGEGNDREAHEALLIAVRTGVVKLQEVVFPH